jgi:hypothetical protein
MLLKKQLLSKDNLNNAFVSKTDTLDQSVASPLVLSYGSLTLKNTWITDSASTSYLRIDPQNNRLIIFDGVNNQQLDVFSSTGSKSTYIFTNTTNGLLDVLGLTQLNIATSSNAKVVIGGITEVSRTTAGSSLNYTIQAAAPSVSRIGIKSTTSLSGTTEVGGIEWNNNGTWNGGIYGKGSGDVQFFTQGDGSNPRVVITYSGNVGVGTASPGYKFDVNGSTGFAANQPVVFKSLSAGYGTVMRYDTAGRERLMISTINSQSKILFHTGYDMTSGGGSTFAEPANPTLSLASGNVGIGAVTYPIAPAPSPRRYLTIRGDDHGVLELTQGTTDASGALVGQIQFTDFNSTSTEKRAAGIVARTNGVTATKRGGVLGFYTKPDNGDSGTYLERMTILDNGYVGINLTAPGVQLDVSGSIRSNTTSSVITLGDGVLGLMATASASTHYPYIEWRGSTGTRGGYLGWGTPGTSIDFTLENGVKLSMNGKLVVEGANGGRLVVPVGVNLYAT